jgi:hypothetical protein
MKIKALLRSLRHPNCKSNENKIQIHILSKKQMQKLNGSEQLVIVKCHDLFFFGLIGNTKITMNLNVPLVTNGC